MRKLFILTLCISCITQVHAVYFSEIMFDPLGSDTSREWVEIYNDTGSGIDFTSWKLFENGTNHGITSYSGGQVLQTSSYAIIADNPIKFLEDYPTYNGVLYDSSFLLSNTGEHIALKQSSSGSEIDATDYSISIGGDNDGSTLSKIDGTWVRGSATPGNVNQSSPLSNDQQLTNSTTTDTQAVVAQASAPLPDIILYITPEKIAVAGADTNFSIFGLTRAGKNIDNLVYTWAYGDGGSGIGSTTVYRYAYPGRYVAQVEGANSYLIGTGRISVRVIPPDISIAKVSTGKYGSYIDIKNPNSYDLDLSQWKLIIDNSSFSFPKNTLIAANSVTCFSGVAMGFASTTISTSTVVKILFPNQEEITRYTLPIATSSILYASSTTILTTASSTTTIKKPITKITQKQNAKIVTSTTTFTAIKSSNFQKDTRIVSFFKSLFSR